MINATTPARPVSTISSNKSSQLPTSVPVAQNAAVPRATSRLPTVPNVSNSATSPPHVSKPRKHAQLISTRDSPSPRTKKDSTKLPELWTKLVTKTITTGLDLVTTKQMLAVLSGDGLMETKHLVILSKT